MCSRKKFFLLSAVLIGCLYSPVASAQLRLKAMFYNVENLFDCRHDSLRDDSEFMPDGDKHWTRWRYREKLLHVAQVVTAVGEDAPPALVGLCEVENDSVMVSLTMHSLLRSAGYRYVMSDCDDPRGVDVALLYRPSQFRLLSASVRDVPVKQIRRDAHARPVLCATGELISGDTLDVLVCHWPSRWGGKKRSEALHRKAAEVVTSMVDSIREMRPQAHILVMGDFNEPPRGAAVQSLPLENLTSSLDGSYRYRGRWEQLDQMLASSPLTDRSSSLHIVEGSAQVFKAPFMLEKEPRFGGYRPLRTYVGPRYLGGYSDHLPVYVQLVADGGN